MDLNKEASPMTHTTGTSAQGVNALAAQGVTLVPGRGNPNLVNAYSPDLVSREHDQGASAQGINTPVAQRATLVPEQSATAYSISEEVENPTSPGEVLMIMGGFDSTHDSVRSLKRHEKIQRANRDHLEQSKIDVPIIFSEDDTEHLVMPHNDPLVVTLKIEDCEVSRILVDTGSSVNLIFIETLEKMGVPLDRIKPGSQPLTSFDGITTRAVGSIKLTVYSDDIPRDTKFMVVERPAVYNAIVGTPWLFSLRAIASVYHQCVKFPTSTGISTIRGSQRMARMCFVAEKHLRMANFQINVTNDASASEPKQESTTQVCIDQANPTRRISIGSELDAPIRAELIDFLTKNINTFAWTIDDMKGINPSVTSHELNVDPTYKPIKQKRRKLGPERSKAVNDEVAKLLEAGSITEVQYPEWLANPVVVKKKNGKWRVCVDFTDLNKACPKDSFPLPHIDRVVEATAGNELLSFMDAFSGYNQIAMHPDDREKTAFITDRGTYCYRVMPFGLKNAGATYQRLVNKMFANQLGDTMEVYIDDMLVKSSKAADHVGHLEECFKILNLYGMKLNPAKCTFGVTSGEFLGYIVTKRGIEANPKQISAIKDLPSPRNKREVQRLTGRIAALNRFISRSTDRSLPFYQLLRGNKEFTWDENCEKAFEDLKSYLTTPPVLAKPEPGETLYLYVSVTEAAVSGVLVREDRGDQKPIFYVSKSLDGAESRYPILEKLALAVIMSARKLRPYFQSHTIAVMSSQPLRAILHSPSQSGRMAKWAIELSEYDIEFRNRTSTKSQVLADFITELPPGIDILEPRQAEWALYIDGSVSRQGAGIGIRLISPTGEILEQSFRLDFLATNNEAEWEALIAGIRLAKEVGARRVHAYSDSLLVTNQLNGDFDTKSERMEAYMKLTEDLILWNLDSFKITQIPRAENVDADALATFASSSRSDTSRAIPMETISDPSISLPRGNSRIMIITDNNERTMSVEITAGDDDEGFQLPEDPSPTDPNPLPDWRKEIIAYIEHGEAPANKWAARRLRTKAAHYVMIEGKLYRWSAAGALLSCIANDQINVVVTESHEGGGGNHSGSRTLALKIKKLGYFWPTMLKDCADHVRCCEKCQRHGPMIKSPTEPLTTATMAYPFMRWAMDIIGPFPRSRQKRFVIVITDYFTKWVEAEAYAAIRANDVQNFVWKFLICRHGLPYEIIADNGSQFISNTFEDFCAKWAIRFNKSTPRNPQGNGQAEATNKAILSELKKRLDEKKGLWSDELDGVLWSLRTTPRESTQRTPFSLAYGLEAMAPAEACVHSMRREFMPSNPDHNDQMLLDNLDYVEEERDAALLRIQNYQQQAARYYNKRVRNRSFAIGDLVLRKVFENTRELNAGKLGANWEGPYQVQDIIRPGVYKLMTMDGVALERSWNALTLKRYYYRLDVPTGSDPPRNIA